MLEVFWALIQKFLDFGMLKRLNVVDFSFVTTCVTRYCLLFIWGAGPSILSDRQAYSYKGLVPANYKR